VECTSREQQAAKDRSFEGTFWCTLRTTDEYVRGEQGVVGAESGVCHWSSGHTATGVTIRRSATAS